MAKSNLDNFLGALLKEDNPQPPPQNTQEFAPVEAPKDVSLDQVIDRYLIRYEKESIPTVDDYESELYGEGLNTKAVLDEALTEAPEDELDLGVDEEEEDLAPEDDAAPADDAGLDLGDGEEDLDAGPGETGDDAAPGEPAVVATPQINLQDFARSVARMVNNYEALLKPQETILNRVEAYITSNYDERTAREFMEMLDTNYSLRTAEESDANQEEFPTPYADGALSTDG